MLLTKFCAIGAPVSSKYFVLKIFLIFSASPTIPSTESSKPDGDIYLLSSNLLNGFCLTCASSVFLSTAIFISLAVLNNPPIKLPDLSNEAIFVSNSSSVSIDAERPSLYLTPFF